MNSALHPFDPSFSLSRISTSAGRSQTLLGALLAATVLLTGCGDSVLDFRNAEISNGKIYKLGDDTGFTGTVTNIPQIQILQQPGLTLIGRTLDVVFPANFNRDRFFMSKSLCDVKLKKGALDGEAICKFPQTEMLHSRMVFKDGALNGAYTRYDATPANHVVVTATFEGGLPNGKQEIFSMETQKIIHRIAWKAGKVDGEEQAFDAQTGNLVASSHYKDGKFDGPVMRWGPDGKMVTYRATLIEGAQNGVEEEFYPDTGKPLRRTEWNHGKKNGQFQEWDAQGQLTRDKVYSNDIERQQPTATPAAATESTSNVSTAANPQACAQAEAAYQLKADSRQGASLEDINEMREACKSAGKRPS